MSERVPVEPEKTRLQPDDDGPDVEGHLLDQPDSRRGHNPDADELDEGDEKARNKKV